MRTSYAVITGASSGIGAEFARQLSGEGYTLVLVARNEARLKALQTELKQKNTHSELVVLDLSKREGCDLLLNYLQDKQVDLFINNAGFGDCGYFLENEIEKELRMVDVNVKAVHYLSKGILKQFEAQGRGGLCNVASSAGLIPAGPYMATYYATKAYVTSLTRAIAQELKEKKSSIYVCALCPGPVDTGFNEVAEVQFALKGITAENCVRQAINGMKQRKTVIVPTLRMKCAVVFGRFLPQALYIRLTGHQQKKKISGVAEHSR